MITIIRVVERLTGQRSCAVAELSQKILMDFVDHAFVFYRRLKFAFKLCQTLRKRQVVKGIVIDERTSMPRFFSIGLVNV